MVMSRNKALQNLYNAWSDYHINPSVLTIRTVATNNTLATAEGEAPLLVGLPEGVEKGLDALPDGVPVGRGFPRVLDP